MKAQIHRICLVLITLCGLTFQNVLIAQTNVPTFDQIYKRQIPSWFNDAKFGVFIVWGIYSVPAWAPKGGYAEWYAGTLADTSSSTYRYHRDNYGSNFTYDKFLPAFTADAFDADAWADLIKKSGAKYVVTAANYHDGFAMYPTKYAVSKFGDKWNAFEQGPKRDVFGEITKAGNAKGLKMGMYYSIYEWWHPLYMKGDIEKYSREHFEPKFKEVVTKYKPQIIFLDGEWEHSYKKWHSDEIANWLYNESPVKSEVVVNDRWGHTRSQFGDYYSSEYGGGDYSPAHPWQEDRGIGKSYGYNKNEDAWDYNSRKELLQLLSTVCSNGGNLLLDIGPTAEGRIPPIMQERLLEIGEWLKINGDAIYQTQASAFWPRKFEWGVITTKGDNLYLHLFDQNLSKLSIQGLGGKVASVSYLNKNQPLEFSSSNNTLSIKIPETKPDVDVSVIVVKMRGKVIADKRPHQYESKKMIIPAWSFNINAPAKMVFDGFEKIAHVTSWTSPVGKLSCDFVINHPGRYRVNIKYTSDAVAAGSTVKLMINSQNLTFTSDDTGGWNGHFYKTKDLGTVDIVRSGKQQLIIAPVEKGWKNVAIKEIVLLPVQ